MHNGFTLEVGLEVGVWLRLEFGLELMLQLKLGL